MIFSFLNDPVKRGWTFTIVILLVIGALAAPLVIGTGARHLTAYGDGAEDASLARTALSGRASNVEAYLSTPHPLNDIREPQRTLLLIIGNERRYSEGETSAILDYLSRGGNVMLADEGGYGSDIARAAGFAFSGQRVVDSRDHLGDPRLVVSNATLEGHPYNLLFNDPTAITRLSGATSDAEVLVHTSAASYPDGSYIDVNGNGEIDKADAAANTDSGFPLVVRTHYGQGTLVLIADTGLFMNEQVKLIDFQNGDFVAALAGAMLPHDGSGTILIDEARHSPGPLVAAYDTAVRDLGVATSGSVAPWITLAVLLLAGLGAWFATRETEDWTHHDHDLGHEVAVPPDVRPDKARAQRMARRRVSERFNIPLEQVAAMTAEELVSLTGDRLLSEAAAGTLKGDPAELFRSFSTTEARSA